MAKSTNLLKSDDESGESGLRLRRNDSWTPTYPSVVPPLSREYPIGKGFRLLPSSDLQKVIPSHDF